MVTSFKKKRLEGETKNWPGVDWRTPLDLLVLRMVSIRVSRRKSQLSLHGVIPSGV